MSIRLSRVLLPSDTTILGKETPVIGIVGSVGAYGRWLRTFFETRMGLRVIGHDPADAASSSEEALLERADVLVFSTPIRHTVALIDRYATQSAGREAGKLWLDVTSIKAAPVAAMLRSCAEVVGLHPMSAPPKAPTLKGRVLVVCEARLSAWRPWLGKLFDALEAECIQATPESHDRAMAMVQAMVHATHLAQAGVLREHCAQAGTLVELMPLRSASFEMDAAIAARILSLNPAIYEDIQFGNPHSLGVVQGLATQLARMAALVEQGDEAARSAFREEFLEANRDALGAAALQTGNYTFERLGYLLADLSDARCMSIHLPEDRPGALRALLHVFEQQGVNIASLHSSRTQAGELHFRLGFDSATQDGQLEAVATVLTRTGIGQVLPG